MIGGREGVWSGLPLQTCQIRVDHDLDKFLESDFRLPAKLFLGFGRITDEEIDFGRALVTGVVFDVFLPIEPDMPEGHFDEFFDRVRLVGSQNEVIGLVGLQHAPHAFDIFGSVAPVALGVHVAEIQFLLQVEFDRGHRAGDFAGDEGFAAARAFVVEENAVAGKEAVTLAVIHGGPVAEHFGATIGTARPERRGLGLRHLLDLAIHLAARGLVKARLYPGFTDSLQNTDRAHPGDVRRVFGNVKTHAHMALGAKIVNFVGLQLVEQLGHVDGIGKVAVMQKQLHSIYVRILIEVIDAGRVEGARPSNDPVHLVTLGDKEVGQIGAILTSDARDKCFFH